MDKRKPISVLLVDDHPIVRDGLRTLRELDPAIEIIGSVGTGKEALAAALARPPDVVLMDIRLPDVSGIELCRRMKAQAPERKILFLTSCAQDEFILSAMEAGGDGYLLKENDARKIIEAIYLVLGGGSVFNPTAPTAPGKATQKAERHSLVKSLTPQEIRVLREVAAGKTDKEVATALGLSTKTARNYLDHVFEKLGVNTRTQAAMVYARNRHLIEPMNVGIKGR